MSLTTTLNSSSIGYSNATLTSSVYDIGTTLVTVTSCGEAGCSTGVEPTGVTVVTETVSGLVTVYTTYCPLTGTTPFVPTTAPYVPTTVATAVNSSTPAIVHSSSAASSSNYTSASLTTAEAGGSQVRAAAGVAALAGFAGLMLI